MVKHSVLHSLDGGIRYQHIIGLNSQKGLIIGKNKRLHKPNTVLFLFDNIAVSD